MFRTHTFNSFIPGCGDLLESLIEVDLWLSSGSVIQNLRKNTFNMFTCQLKGVNEYTLIENQYDHLMYEEMLSDNVREGAEQYKCFFF